MSGSGGGRTNSELRDFLHSRRAKVTPEQVGLTADGSNRRVLGLRREELAQLAGISVDYYTRLERGRRLNVSDSVLDSLARALLLSSTEREHLYRLARRNGSGPASDLARHRVRPGLQLVLDSLHESPALILGHRLDVLASNQLARALYTDWNALAPGQRNMARFVFFDAAARTLYADWPAAARSVVSALNLYAGRHPRDPDLADLVAELSARDQDFDRWWAARDVHRHTHGFKTFHHPLVGELTLRYETFRAFDEPDHMLGIDLAEPGSRAQESLHVLASWIAQPDTRPTWAHSPPHSR
jgi:transcriptional regulator with XRE-family HTH domain